MALTKDGKRPLHAQIEAVASAYAAECRIAVIDISARRQVEEKLCKSERQLAEAQTLAHIGSWEWDSIADEISGSDEFNRVFGLILSSYDSFMEVVHPNDREMVNMAVEKTLDRQASYNVHYRIIRPDGITRVIHAQGVAVTDGTGKTIRMIGTAQDVTERREMEGKLEILLSELAARAFELEAANRELEAFNAAVSHDLRKPLTNINGYCQVMQNFCAEQKEDCKIYIREIYEATLRMDRLISTLLKFSHALRAEMQYNTVNLSGMAREVATSLERTEPERRVSFLFAEEVKVNGDASLLLIVLDNLIGNAWKFTENREGTVIEFGVTGKEGEPVYFVRDNGPGFDMADADKLFVPFKRLHELDVPGHGIGLSTVERIIRRHGGRVWAEGEPGKVATFYFTLATDGVSNSA
ncbi:MAG TPA: ATP-binding protein [Geobacteraceae bacterium]|nr:ATP-binding protein [Geobacteraceae bacterium]